jgi:hypothetical protein
MDPAPPDTIIGGLRTLRELLVIGLVVAFVLLYGDFIVEIWQARLDNNWPPKFNDGVVSLAGALAGVLGTAFAVALGVAKPAANTNTTRRMAAARNRFSGLSLSLTLGIWAYAIVGAAAAVTATVNLEETPDPVKALSSVFVGYILALASTAFRPVRS